MAKISKQVKDACAEAQKLLQDNPSVVSVGIGYKYRNGVRTDEVCIQNTTWLPTRMPITTASGTLAANAPRSLTKEMTTPQNSTLTVVRRP